MSNTLLNNESLEEFVTAIFVDGANASARFGFDDPKYAERKKEVVELALKRLKDRIEKAHAAVEPLTNIATVEDGVLFCAFRYALGRRTYVVRDVCEAIKQNVNGIQRKLCDQMVQEISEAVNTYRVGDHIHAKRWLECRDILQRSLVDKQVI